jgi:hypothetical protein
MNQHFPEIIAHLWSDICLEYEYNDVVKRDAVKLTEALTLPSPEVVLGTNYWTLMDDLLDNIADQCSIADMDRFVSVLVGSLTLKPLRDVIEYGVYQFVSDDKTWANKSKKYKDSIENEGMKLAWCLNLLTIKDVISKCNLSLGEKREIRDLIEMVESCYESFSSVSDEASDADCEEDPVETYQSLCNLFSSLKTACNEQNPHSIKSGLGQVLYLTTAKGIDLEMLCEEERQLIKEAKIQLNK